KVNYDGYFLEYDTERAGGFEPLRFVPKGNKQIVLGLVTSKSGTLEKKEDIKARIKEAEKFVALDQLCLLPHCGERQSWSSATNFSASLMRALMSSFFSS